MALSVIRLKSIKESFELSFTLPEKKQWKVICPNPIIADATSRKLQNHPSSCESLTISKFLGDIYQELHSDREVMRKSELLRILATVWKLKFSNEQTYYFEQAFELFTDLRSFTLDPLMIENLLDHYDPIVANAVRYFWLIIDDQEIVDEHLAYYLILQGLEQGNVETNDMLADTGLVFQGFTHLSGSQIDLLKMLGRFCEVIVPLTNEVLEESVKTDWVDWILTQADKVIEAESRQVCEPEYGDVIEYEKLAQNDAISSVIDQGQADILFVKNALSFQKILSLSQRNLFFKTEMDLFKGISKHYQVLIDREFSGKKGIATQELLEFIDKGLATLIEQTNKNFQLFAEIKFLKTLEDEISMWSSLSSENETLDEFSIKVVWEILTLNLPRNFNIPLIAHEASKVVTLSELSNVDSTKKNIIIVDDGHDLKGGSASAYSKEVSEILYTLGPIRRKGLDISFYKAQLRELLANKNCVLLIEKGLIEQDKLWNGIVRDLTDKGKKDVTCFVQNKSRSHVRRPSISIIDHDSTKAVSASRLQTFLECPRKYYYSYVLKMGNEPPRHMSVDPRLLGNFEHEIVQKYLKKNRVWDDDSFKEVVQEVIKLPKTLTKSPTLNEETNAEVMYYAKIMIHEFLKIIEVDNEALFFFESAMQGEGAVGFADVYIQSKVFGRMLFDLKRSAGSIPSKSEVLKMSSIQLWYYMEFLENKREYFDIYGYLNFADPASSLIFSNNKESSDKLLALDFSEVDKIHLSDEEYELRQEEFLEVYQEARDSIMNKKEFPIRPLSGSVCHFCPGRIICNRGVEQ